MPKAPHPLVFPQDLTLTPAPLLERNSPPEISLGCPQEYYSKECGTYSKHVGHAFLVLEESLFISATLGRLFTSSSSMCEVAPCDSAEAEELREVCWQQCQGLFHLPNFSKMLEVREEPISNLLVWTSSSALVCITSEFSHCVPNFERQNIDTALFKWESRASSLCNLHYEKVGDKEGESTCCRLSALEACQHDKSRGTQYNLRWAFRVVYLYIITQRGLFFFKDSTVWGTSVSLSSNFYQHFFFPSAYVRWKNAQLLLVKVKQVHSL